MVRVALTGTPGVGKTTLAAIARRDGWRVIDVKAWAKESGAVVAYDRTDEAEVVDLEVLRVLVEPDEGEKVLYEGHLSHFLGLDVAWVVRCDPQELRSRLALRGYPEGKVRENLECEALDLILQEAQEHTPRVIQRDGTRRTPEELYTAFAEATGRAAKEEDLEPVDWSDQLPFDAPADPVVERKTRPRRRTR